MRKQIVLFLLPLIPISSGCATSSFRDGWTRSMAAVGLGSREGVSKEFREAQKVFKNPEATLLAYARLKEDNEEYAEAREKYREILAGYPSNVDARLGLARIEMATGRTEQSRQILDELTAQHPDNPLVHREIGRLYQQQENWAAAIAQFEKASELKPDDQMIRFELGLAMVRAGHIDKAMPHLSFAVGDSAAMYNVGYVLQESGQAAAAIEWYQKALNSHPDARTAFQSQQMLSQLMPAEEDSAAEVAAAARAAQVRLAMNPDQNSPIRIMPQIHGHVSETGVTEFTPNPESSMSQVQSTASVVQTDRSAFRTASWGTPAPQSDPFVTSPEPVDGGFAASGDVPQWRGPSKTSDEGRMQEKSLAAVNASGQIQQPPAWRARH